MKKPITQHDAFVYIVKETARMSYPASMSRGKKQVVAGKTKMLVEQHLVENFPISDVWDQTSRAFTDFDTWHEEQINAMATAIDSNVKSGNLPFAVAAKFVNTFLHQLIKYEAARPLIPNLHLPLDNRVFGKLRGLKSSALKPFKNELSNSPYRLSYNHHLNIQAALLEVMQELNVRQGTTHLLRSRIELNWLWL